MSIAELVPRWQGLPEPSGPVLEGMSLKRRSYRLRSDLKVECELKSVLEVRGLQASDAFLEPSVTRDMPSPWLLKDMDKASERLARAFVQREKVVVFGDYDVDGAASTAIIATWFRDIGLPVEFYIPDRISEGYGPSEVALKRALASDPDLVIFVDCGTGAAALLNDLLCDVVVIDHHKAQGALPEVLAVINPHREDDESGLTMLCAAGLSMLVVTAARKVLRDNGHEAGNLPLGHLFELVALATVADVVPLVGPSRLFVSAGLARMRKAPSEGVKALMNVAGITDVSAGRIGFALGPRVNAGGRVGDGSVGKDGAAGVRLLMAGSEAEAMELAALLDSLNRERQEVEKGCLEAALEAADDQVARGVKAVMLYDAGWHPGIVGIVAGRIKERFDRPTMVGAEQAGVIKGSGRSVPGLDLGAIIIEAKARGLLVSGGGHAMACGFACDVGRWEDFKAFVEERASWQAQPTAVDLIVDAAGLDEVQIARLSLLEPLGQGMPAVRIAAFGCLIDDVREIGTGHVKLGWMAGGQRMEGIWWRAADDGVDAELRDLKGRSVTAIGVPGINEWQGRQTISLTLSDLILEDV